MRRKKKITPRILRAIRESVAEYQSLTERELQKLMDRFYNNGKVDFHAEDEKSYEFLGFLDAQGIEYAETKVKPSQLTIYDPKMWDSNLKKVREARLDRNLAKEEGFEDINPYYQIAHSMGNITHDMTEGHGDPIGLSFVVEIGGEEYLVFYDHVSATVVIDADQGSNSWSLNSFKKLFEGKINEALHPVVVQSEDYKYRFKNHDYADLKRKVPKGETIMFDVKGGDDIMLARGPQIFLDKIEHDAELQELFYGYTGYGEKTYWSDTYNDVVVEFRGDTYNVDEWINSIDGGVFESRRSNRLQTFSESISQKKKRRKHKINEDQFNMNREEVSSVLDDIWKDIKNNIPQEGLTIDDIFNLTLEYSGISLHEPQLQYAMDILRDKNVTILESIKESILKDMGLKKVQEFGEKFMDLIGQAVQSLGGKYIGYTFNMRDGSVMIITNQAMGYYIFNKDTNQLEAYKEKVIHS